ncbi:hypothetical protein E6O75_ATG03579 [Venturia nashicola]|uniref:Xylanolytic transcriptional activator regulatory domain-containing protein n=1 Tax=Venturia nashicola TaxID=86259 RepID=A0A4Z1PJB6_9PEZI|nr:hypothetical protein E6O75_ATG03579 [Venturia nashicola]
MNSGSSLRISASRPSVSQAQLYPSPPSHFDFNERRPVPTLNTISAVNGANQSNNHVLPVPINSEFLRPSSSTKMTGMPASGLADDFVFLEEFLLPNMGNMIPSYSTPISIDGSQNGASSLAPSLDPTPDQPGKGPDPARSDMETRKGPDDSSYAHVFDTSEDDCEKFKQRFLELYRSQMNGFVFPRRSRLVRCITAYFDHFDCHVPIIHHATFGISQSHPGLVFMILALGGLQLGEKNFASKVYDIGCALIDSHLATSTNPSGEAFDSWPIQALLLGVQFSAFGEEGPYNTRAQRHYATASDLLKAEQDRTKIEWETSNPNWEQWARVETFSRLSLWACTLSAMILATDATANYMPHYQLREVPIPLREELWRARSASEWARITAKTGLYKGPNLGALVRALSAGDSIPEDISSFGLLALIGWATSSICLQERVAMSMGPSSAIQGDFLREMERVLNEWENFAYRRLKSGQAIHPDRETLFTDCFPLLGSAYYHLYVGDELRALKETANRSAENLATTKPPLPQFQLSDSALKAVRYAANSWLVRVKLGIGNWRVTNIVGYGVQYLITAYESALILSWWLSASRPPLAPQDSTALTAINDLMSKAFAEVEEQEIPISDAQGRMISPLVYTSQCVDRNVYPYAQKVERALNVFKEHLLAIAPASG